MTLIEWISALHENPGSRPEIDAATFTAEKLYFNGWIEKRRDGYAVTLQARTLLHLKLATLDRSRDRHERLEEELVDAGMLKFKQ